MNNIWEFLVMTLTVSLSAGLIMIIKALLKDKLTPRWQYGIWSLLIIRMLLPVAVSNRYVLAPIPMWVETLKALCESHLSSSYSQTFIPVDSPWFLPVITSAPQSITDWIFVFYAAGVVINLLICLISYVKLRRIISEAQPFSAANALLIDNVCEKYGLKACHAVEIEGLPSAFVCGITKPVLVLPVGTLIDEKIILHELLHLKYKDALQSVIWTVFRALHWCNPFMHYVFNCIGNDMEALCDRRVLEMLEGEERRDYGKILLLMANDRYPRAFGTTSLSNGGKNIARRIACIAHFKKYPKGMALVSVCIGIMLIQPLFFGSEFHGVASSINDYSAANSEMILQKDLASARLNRCTTVAGAIDTYAKGLIYENGLYLAAASPLSEQKKLYEQMCASLDYSWVYTHVENNLGARAFARSPNPEVSISNPYEVCNIKQSTFAPDEFQCQLVIYSTSNDADALPGISIIPLSVCMENGSWVVVPSGETEFIEMDESSWGHPRGFVREILALTPISTYEGIGTKGYITASCCTFYNVNNTVETQNDLSWFLGNSFNFNEVPVTNAEFEYADMDFDITYTFTGEREKLKNISYVTLENMFYDSAADIPSDPEARMDDENFAPIKDSGAGSSSTGWSYQAETYDNHDWNGTIRDINSGGRYYTKRDIIDALKVSATGDASLPPVENPEVLVARVYIDGFDTEYIISKEVSRNEQ
ncbi:MAG: M56 family metallopeptidase [Anaerovoracaceae bacterium]